jgi:hypothetical protein
VLFEEFIQQHRVHRLIAHGVDFSARVAKDEVGVYFFHFLCDEAELRDAIGIEFVLIVERYRSQRENRFTRLLHGFDLILETLRRERRHTELTVGINDNGCARNRCSANARDKRGRLAAAYADGAALAGNTAIADVDIVTAGGEITAGVNTYCDVGAATGVVTKRLKTGGGVAAAGIVARERLETIGRVEVASGVGSVLPPVAVLLLPKVLLWSA